MRHGEGTGGSCSSAARRDRLRRRRAGVPRGSGVIVAVRGATRRTLCRRVVRRHGAGGRGRARGGSSGAHAAASSPRWPASAGAFERLVLEVCTGPTRRRSTSCAARRPSSRSRRWAGDLIATTSSKPRASLRIVLGDSLLRHTTVSDHAWPARPGAVAALAGSGGKCRSRGAASPGPPAPFFVTEAATADDAIRDGVRDVVLAASRAWTTCAGAATSSWSSAARRAAGAGGAGRRRPGAARRVPGPSGVLHADRDTVGLFATIRRGSRSKEASAAPRWCCIASPLGALAGHRRRPDPARLAHHAEAADDAGAGARHATPARRRAGLYAPGGAPVRRGAALSTARRPSAAPQPLQAPLPVLSERRLRRRHRGSLPRAARYRAAGDRGQANSHAGLSRLTVSSATTRAQ